MHVGLVPLLVLVAQVGAGPPSTVRVTTLRCEYAANPLGIYVREPRLSCILESARRG